MRRPRLRLVSVTLLALASLGALLVARPPLSATTWSRGEDLALFVAWAVAVGASAWLFALSCSCVVALRCSRPDVARRLAPALPAGIRRLVEVALVGELALVASCAALPTLPAGAVTPPPGAAVVVVDQPVVRAPEAAPPVAVAPSPTPSPAPAPASAATPAAPRAATHVVVRPGDNLWIIARVALGQPSGHRPSEAEVARYWHAVIVANRATLRSGNPSLVFPGEIVALPAPASVS